VYHVVPGNWTSAASCAIKIEKNTIDRQRWLMSSWKFQVGLTVIHWKLKRWAITMHCNLKAVRRRASRSGLYNILMLKPVNAQIASYDVLCPATQSLPYFPCDLMKVASSYIHCTCIYPVDVGVQFCHLVATPNTIYYQDRASPATIY